MAKALQCNRCKRCFNPLTVEGLFMHFSNPAIRTREDYKNCVSGVYFVPDGGSNEMIDLCPACTEEFITFMEEPKHVSG